MNDVSHKAHWENVYTTKSENEVRWFQENPAPSLELIDLAQPTPEAAIVNLGGGASRLVDGLVARGFSGDGLGPFGGGSGRCEMLPARIQRKPTTFGTIARLSISSLTRATVLHTSRG